MLEKGKLISNSLSILISRLAQSITAFILTASIARILGAEALGQYLLAFSYYFIFVNIASQGLKILFTRELSQHPEKTSIFLTNGTLLQLLFSLIGYAALLTLVFVLPYSTQTSNVCYIMGLTIIPFSLSNITEAIFQAQEKMHLIAISTVPIYILRLLGMIWAMQMDYKVEALAIILFVSELIILLIEWILLLPIVKIVCKFDKSFIWNTVKTARTFFAIEGIAVVNNRFQILLLSLLGNEALVGIYGGISQLMQPFLIIANSISTAIFPSLSKAVVQGKKSQQKITENLIEILLIISLPLLIGCLFFSQDLLLFLYNPSFVQGSLALKIVSCTLLFLPFNRSLPFLLVANGYERINLRILIVNTTLAGFLGIFLVSQLKLIGSSLTDLTAIILSFVQHIYYTYRYILSLNFVQIIRRPFIISILMIPVFLILRTINLDFSLKLLVSVLTYISIVSFFLVRTLGGIRVVWLRLLRKA